MSKTYTLLATSIKGGKRSQWTSNTWKDLNLNGDAGKTCAVGGSDSGYLYCTYLLFDQEALAALRSKAILSATLSLTVESGTIPKSGSTYLGIGYKLNGSEGETGNGPAWTRTDETGESEGNYSSAYLRGDSGKDTIASNTTLVISLADKVIPKYGFVVGPNHSTYKKKLLLKASAILTVVTDESDTFTVSYDMNGGTGGPGPQTKTGDEPLTLSTVAPVWGGHLFQGWNTKADGSGDQYIPGGVYYSNADAVLYAQWRSISYLSLIYNANGGSGAPSPQQVFPGGTFTLSTKIPTRSGYRFAKWNTKANGTGTSYRPGGTLTYTGMNGTLYAQWVEQTDSSALVKGSDGELHQGSVYVKGLDGEMYEATVYVKGSDGDMHQAM